MNLFSGLKAWYYQRISGIFLLFALPYVAWSVVTGDWTHTSWVAWVTGDFNRVVLLLTAWILLLHAWVGLRDVVIDYISHAWGKLLVLTLAASTLAGLGLWVTNLLFLH